MASTSTSLDTIRASSNPATTEVKNTSTKSDSSTIASDYDTFMKLLTTQLKNQDPTNPTDTNEYTNQLVAFSGVEQQVKTNDYLKQLVSSNGDKQLSTAVGYIGSLVDAKGDAGYLQDKSATFAYNLDKAATSVNVTIKNDAGQVVYTGAGTKDKGMNYVSWNGTNNVNSTDSADGVYHISVVAKDANDKTITSTTYTTGTATGAELDSDGNIQLTVANTKVKMDDVVSVRQQPTKVVSNSN